MNDRSVKVTSAEAGEQIIIPTTQTVGPACASQHGQWHCLTHQLTFLNNFQKDGHLGDTGRSHKLVWVCFEHGPEATS